MSPDPALRLRPGRPSDVEAMADIFLDAFSGNTIGRTFFPRNTASARDFWLKALAEEIHDPNSHFITITDTTNSSDSSQEPPLIAFAKWVSPHPLDTKPVPSTPIPTEDEWPSDGDPKLAMVFFQKLADMHQQIMQDRRHWYLEMIVTRAAHQGRGAGAMMMEWGVQRADEDGVECYLDATPEGKPLYGRYGFVDVETWRFFDEVYVHSFMVRKKTREEEGAGAVMENGG